MKYYFVAPILFYLKFWAKLAIAIHKPETIGIAGSVGKSSTRNALFAILKEKGKVRVVHANSESGVPLGILGIEVKNYSILSWFLILLSCPLKVLSLTQFKYMVCEMGIDDPFPPKNMSYLLSIIKPDISISLNISSTHTQQFEKLLKYAPPGKDHSEFLLEKIAEQDTKIITESNCRVGIYNKDDKYIVDAIKKHKGRLLSFGGSNADCRYVSYDVSISGTNFTLNVSGKNISIEAKNYALPHEYSDVFAAALLASYALKIDVQASAGNLSKYFVLPKGRGSLITGVNNLLIIDSSYNSSTRSTIAYLNVLNALKNSTKKRAIFLMGDMRELGEQAEREHKIVAKQAESIVDALYCVGPLTKAYVIPNVNTKHKKWFQNAKLASEFIKKNETQEAIILVKGSQNEIFLEEAVKLLLSNKADVNRLCRQTKYWKGIKSKFFNP